MYKTNDDHDGYCLFSSYMSPQLTGHQKMYLSNHQTIAYCLRPSEGSNSIIKFDNIDTTDPRLTFSDLKQRNITSGDLLSWSVSIDLAERYQIYLNNDSNSIWENTAWFYNCTSSWFGPSCRFTFDWKMEKTFDDIVERIFVAKLRITKDAKVACYQHLHCQTLLSCLSWHEICDGKNDCLDGTDENYCWQLEINQCAANEFRCHNGQCIPMEFFRDASTIPDCLDRTDESINKADYSDCFTDASFRCEEGICHPSNVEFPCGDGECTDRIGSCNNGRTSFLPIDFCSNATACLMYSMNLVDVKWCKKFCPKNTCIKNQCPMIYELRYIPILFGHVRILYTNKAFVSNQFSTPDYICYDEKRCVDFPLPTEDLLNFTCRQFNDVGLKDIQSYDNIADIILNVKNHFRLCSTITDVRHCSNDSSMYQCRNSSKCISQQRLLDGIQDCLFNDDETFEQSCSLNDIDQRFRCSDSITDRKCFAALALEDGKKNCLNGEDEGQNEEDDDDQRVKHHISFQTICDGKQELSPMLIDGRNETDETDCEHWLCNNTYSRCDQFWLCKDGADEVNCPRSNCPAHQHQCVLPNDQSKISCLPIAKAGNGIVDCLGGTDEREKYFVSSYNDIHYYFQCWKSDKSIAADELCDNETNCPFNDDETFCSGFAPRKNAFCIYSSHSFKDVDRLLCNLGTMITRPSVVIFKLGYVSTYSLLLGSRNSSILPSNRANIRSTLKRQTVNMTSVYAWRCNRGVPIRLRLYANKTDLYCLCPPSYYGDQCQYQNQRVSLTVRLRMISNWRSVFIVIINLYDDERKIQFYDHIEYLPARDCRNKFNVYLTYSTRPKNVSRHHFVQIDIYNQYTLTYRASWIFPLRFPFLPVHRLPVFLKVPFSNAISVPQRCWPPCIHGQCFSYVNDQKSTFCRCEQDWSGMQCNVNYICDCASDSLCIGPSICLCPRDRFGPRCHLSHHSCHWNSCMHGGQCVPIDSRITDKHSSPSTCICPEGYLGDRCQYRQQQNRIDISFHHEIVIPSSLLVHFIAIQTEMKPNRTSIMKKIGFDQYALILYTPVSFNMGFAQIFNEYYLIILHEQTITLSHVSTQIVPSHRCRPLHELFNETFVHQHLLKRIKSYHIPCRQQPELVCFRDDVHLCLCTIDRQSNCFEFNFNMTYNCGGDNFCANEGHCFLDDAQCPTSSFCACRQCYFGSLCQFSSKGSTLSLDTILIYHILLNTAISQQPPLIKMAISLTTLMFIVGFVNSLFSFQTFRRKETRYIGCGVYLLVSSIISMLMTIVFMFKFWFLLLSQIGLITNRLFLFVQCLSVDFLLRFLVSTSDWLSACVAIERAVTVAQGIKFNQAKSQQMAKWIAPILLLCTACTFLYDPIHRRLIDDEEEQRTWCVINYSSTMQIVDWLLNIFHFILPFSINCISGLIIIVTVARSRSKSQTMKSFKEHLREQTQRHKHLLISSSILVILGVPRLVISFLSGCMESARDSWFYLLGYLISFVPPIMTFVVFVLPSAVYKKEFHQSIRRIWKR